MPHRTTISDDEPALASMDQDLRKLEKHIVEGVQLSGAQLRTLADYRDRIDRLIGQSPLPTYPGADRKQAPPTAPDPPHKLSKREVNDQSASDLRKAIRECLGPDYS